MVEKGSGFLSTCIALQGAMQVHKLQKLMICFSYEISNGFSNGESVVHISILREPLLLLCFVMVLISGAVWEVIITVLYFVLFYRLKGKKIFQCIVAIRGNHL